MGMNDIERTELVAKITANLPFSDSGKVDVILHCIRLMTDQQKLDLAEFVRKMSKQ